MMVLPKKCGLRYEQNSVAGHFRRVDISSQSWIEEIIRQGAFFDRCAQQ